MSAAGDVVGRARASRPWQAWERFGRNRGTVLAGGMTYASFFSLFPALAVGFTIFGLALGNDPELQDRVVTAVNDSFGTPLIKLTDDGPGVITVDTLTDGSGLTITGIVGLLGLLWTGLGWLGAMREGIRAMFGQPPAEGNVVATKTRDVAVLVTIGVVVLFSALSGVVVNGTASTVLGWIGLDGSAVGRFLLSVASTLALLAVDWVVFVVLFRFLSGVPLRREDVRDGALFAAIALGVVKLFAGLLLGRLTDNELLAFAAVALGLLVWLNLIARITLLGAAWVAVTASDRGHLIPPTVTADQQARTRQLAAGVARAAAVPEPRPLFTPVVSPRAADKVSVAAGAVLGAAGMVGARVAANAVRSLAALAARRDRD